MSTALRGALALFLLGCDWYFDIQTGATFPSGPMTSTLVVCHTVRTGAAAAPTGVRAPTAGRSFAVLPSAGAAHVHPALAENPAHPPPLAAGGLIYVFMSIRP
jgi:hypothetical protein